MRNPGPTLRRRVLRGDFDRFLLPRLTAGAEHALATGEGLLFDPSGTTAVGPSDDPDVLFAQEDLNWIALGMGGGLGYSASRITNRTEVLRLLASMVDRNPIAANIVNNYTYFVAGPGFSFDLPTDEAKEEFDEWAESPEIDLYESLEEAVYTTALFGESFLVGYPVREIGKDPPKGPPAPAQETHEHETFRVLDPFAVTDIEVNPTDAKEVWGYRLSLSEGKAVWIDPRDVIHLSFRRRCRQVHSLPLLFPAITPLQQIEKFAENRYFLNYVRTRFPVIRQDTGPGGRTAQQEKQDPKWAALPPPATMIFDKGPITWHFPSLNVGSGDVWEDWRALVLRIASAVSLPEYLVVMDASNSNYASTLVAESPAHHLFKSLQARVARRIARLLGWFWTEKIRVTPAKIIKRDRNEDSQALSAALDRRVISRQTMCVELGFEWEGEDGERARIERERELGLDVMPGALPGEEEEKKPGEEEEDEEAKGKQPPARGNGKPAPARA